MSFFQIRHGLGVRKVRTHHLEVVRTGVGEIWVRVPAGGIIAGRGSPAPGEAFVEVRGEGTVARRHCAISAAPGGSLLVVDLRSSGGTFVNDHDRVLAGAPARLRDGDVIYLGAPSCAVTMTFRVELPPLPT